MNKFERIIREENNRVKQLIGNDFALTDPSVIDAIHHSNFDYEKAKQSPEYLAILETGFKDVSTPVQQKHGNFMFQKGEKKYAATNTGWVRQTTNEISVYGGGGRKFFQVHKTFTSFKEEFEWILKNIAKNSKKQ